jgi:hypothetical protein
MIRFLLAGIAHGIAHATLSLFFIILLQNIKRMTEICIGNTEIRILSKFLATMNYGNRPGPAQRRPDRAFGRGHRLTRPRKRGPDPAGHLDAISTLVEGRTVLVIAQRLRTVASADQIIVLAEGCVVEHGNREQLMAKDGLYHRLYLLQQESQGWTVRSAGSSVAAT